MNEGEKHHYIPQFYLKQWTGADRRLCEYSCPYDRLKARRRFPSETGFEYGLTTSTTYPEPVSEIVERKLMQAIDDSASKAFRYLLANNVIGLDANGRSAWARFLMSLMRRTPEAVQDIHDRLQRSFAEIDRLNPPPPDASEEELAADRLGRVEQRKALLLQDLVNSELNGTALINMRWIVNRRLLARADSTPVLGLSGLLLPDLIPQSRGYLRLPIQNQYYKLRRIAFPPPQSRHSRHVLSRRTRHDSNVTLAAFEAARPIDEFFVNLVFYF